jgi:BMFP domain-containing protein YqiC
VSEVFLGIIAIAVAVMAIIQVAAIVFAARAARSVGEAVSQFQEDVRPIVANLQTLSTDAARAAASAAAQVERAQKTVEAVLNRVDLVGARVEQTVQMLHNGILAPAREGYAVMQAIRAIFSPSRSSRQAPRSRPVSAEEEDALFIG